MKPIEPDPYYGRLVTYAANQPEYNPLPARVSDDGLGVVTTRWQLTEDERKALIAGADIQLRVMTFGQALQPVYLWVAGTDPDEDPPSADPWRDLPPERRPGDP